MMNYLKFSAVAKVSLFLTLVCLVLNITLAQADDDEVVIGKRAKIKSKVLNEERPLLIYLPDRYEQTDTKYPVLYFLDGNNHFHHATATVQFLSRNGRMPQVIVVAIPNTDRDRDFTPTRIEERPETGGADEFMEFMQTELFPYVEKNYRTQPYRILFGHSLTGMFAAYTLLKQSDMFSAYIALSPYLMYDDNYVVKYAKSAIEKPFDSSNFLYMTYGNEPNYEATLSEFTQILDQKEPEQLEWSLTQMKNESHGSIPLKSLYNGLEKLYDDWRIQGNLAEIGGLPGLQKHFEQASQKYGYAMRIPETHLNLLGYQLLGQKKYDEAIKIFKHNVKLYPSSANVYDSLGEGYEADGQLQLAKQNYEMAYRKGKESNDPYLQLFKNHLDNIQKKLAKMQ